MPSERSTSSRGLWITIIVLIGWLAAAGTAAAFYLAEADAKTIMTRAGAAWVASVAIGLSIRKFMDSDSG
jgi:flagellar basal body-associated protein FliL